MKVEVLYRINHLWSIFSEWYSFQLGIIHFLASFHSTSELPPFPAVSSRLSLFSILPPPFHPLPLTTSRQTCTHLLHDASVQLTQLLTLTVIANSVCMCVCIYNMCVHCTDVLLYIVNKLYMYIRAMYVHVYTYATINSMNGDAGRLMHHVKISRSKKSS